MRVQDISSIIRECSCAEFLLFIEETDDCTFCNLQIRTYSFKEANLHIVHKPALLEYIEGLLILLYLLLVLVVITISKLELNIVASQVQQMLRVYELLERKCRALNLLAVPPVILRVQLPDVRVFLFIHNPMGRRVILTQEVCLRLYSAIHGVFWHRSVVIVRNDIAYNRVLHVPSRSKLVEWLPYEKLPYIIYLDSIHNPFTFLFFFFVKLNIIT